MEVTLIVANGKQMGKKISVSSSKFLIGRGEECHLRPQSSMVSRKHCLISIEDNSAAIERTLLSLTIRNSKRGGS